MISIIIPIRNEQEKISGTINSILSQSYEGEIEIIIVDGMSNDGTREIINSYKEKYSYIKIIDNPEKYVSTGFNRALSISKGEIIIRIDGHAEAGKDYIVNCIKVLKNIDADCVGGFTHHHSNTLIGKHISVAQSSKFGTGGASFRTSFKYGSYVDTLAFGAYKRNVFLRNGGYDEELIKNQDEEFNYRLIQNGGKIWMDTSINSRYYVRDSLLKLFSQYYYYGFYKVRVFQKIRSIFSFRHFVPPIFVFTLISFIVIGIFQKILLPILFLGGGYLFMNITFSVYESVKHKTKSLVLLPIIYFIMHFSYGLGFLAGLVFFANKWRASTVMDNSFKKENFSLKVNA